MSKKKDKFQPGGQEDCLQQIRQGNYGSDGYPLRSKDLLDGFMKIKENCLKKGMYVEKKDKLKNNPVDHPAHYTSHPSGIEAIEVCGKMGFCLGNAFKYLFRMENKWNPLEDIKKAKWYIDREAFQREYDIKSKFTPEKWDGIPQHFISVADLNIVKIVGENPGNIEKALYHIYEADINAYGYHLSYARYYINRELKRRSRNSKKTTKKEKK
jgi:hypothetical protein